MLLVMFRCCLVIISAGLGVMIKWSVFFVHNFFLHSLCSRFRFLDRWRRWTALFIQTPISRKGGETSMNSFGIQDMHNSCVPLSLILILVSHSPHLKCDLSAHLEMRNPSEWSIRLRARCPHSRSRGSWTQVLNWPYELHVCSGWVPQSIRTREEKEKG